VSDLLRLVEEARRALGRLPAALDALLGDIDEATARTRPAEGEWAPVEILCHLRDEETEDFGARLRAVVGGGGELPPIDPERWAVERRYQDARLVEVREDLRARRQASLDLLATMTPAMLTTSRPLGTRWRLSGADVIAAWVTHDRLHLTQLAGTLARLWASRWPDLLTGYAGPIPYPPPPPSSRAGG